MVTRVSPEVLVPRVLEQLAEHGIAAREVMDPQRGRVVRAVNPLNGCDYRIGCTEDVAAMVTELEASKR